LNDDAPQLQDVSLCIVRLGRGERVSEGLALLLSPIDPATMHQYRLPPNTDVELHYHDFDEYWVFLSGRPKVTLRSAAGTTEQYQLEPGDMVACRRGVEHTLWADHELIYLQFSSVRGGWEREGHLRRSS
jgi:mannose-6-phosphate isomerase-like protein (cupin superfamily)